MRGSVRWGTTALVVALAAFGFHAQAKRVTITYTTWSTDAAEKEIIDRFMKANPDIVVRYQPYSGDVTAYMEKMLTMLAAGMSPDVIRCKDTMIGRFHQAKLFVNLNGYLKRDRIPEDSWFKGNYDLFGFGNSQVALPIAIVSPTVFYNTEMVERAGLPPLQKYGSGGQWTREQWAECAKKLTKDGNGDGKPEQYGITDGFTNINWMRAVRQEGGEVFTKDGKKCVLNSHEATGALQFLQDLILKHKAYNPAPPWNGLAVKAGAMMHTSGWIMQHLVAAKIPFDLTTTYKSRSKRFFYAAGDGMGVSSLSKNKEAAWRLLKWFATEPGASYAARVGNVGPAYRRVASSKEFLDSFKGKNLEALVDGADDFFVQEPRAPKYLMQIEKAITDHMNAFFSGKKGAAPTVASLQDTLNRLLR